MTILPALLLFAIEFCSEGVYRAGALALVALATSAFYFDRLAQFSFGRCLAGAAIAVTAAASKSDFLLWISLLVLLPGRKANSTATLVLTMTAFHLLWWRYISPLDSAPLSGAVRPLNLLLPRDFYLTSTSVIFAGKIIRFSLIPVSFLVAPLIATALVRQSISLLWFLIRVTLAALGGLLVTVVFANAGHTHFFSQAWWPLAMMGVGLAATYSLGPQEFSLPEINWGYWTISVVVVFGFWFSQPASDGRSLKISFDEAHGSWEPSVATLDVNSYGRDTVYNYELLKRWLASKHAVSQLTARWSRLDTDVIIVKMPTSFYEASEKNALDAFLRRGGLLLVVADHTNLFGTSYVINDLLQSYGMRVESNATVPWVGEHYAFKPKWWQQSRFLRGVDQLQFQTAATIRSTSPMVIPILVADRVAAEEADYSNERFFGDLHPTTDDLHAPLVLAAERRVGDGRIVVFSDSTIFSTFSMMTPGNRELFQNFVEQGVRGRSWIRLLVIAALCVAVWVFATNRVLTVAAAVPVLFALSSVQWGHPKAYPADWLVFDAAHSHIELLADPRGAHGPAFNDYSTFVAWVARVGKVPLQSDRAFDDPKLPSVVLNPDKPFGPDALDEIEHYLRQGGRLLLLDDPRFFERSTSTQLLERFGVNLRAVPDQSSSLFDPKPLRPATNLFALPLAMLDPGSVGAGAERVSGTSAVTVPVGLEPSLVDRNGAVVAGQKSVGAGKLVVFLRSTAFSEVVMGDVWVGTDVDPERRRLYELEYDLLRAVTNSEGARP